MFFEIIFNVSKLLLLCYRRPDEKEPECTPSKLFRVEQIKSAKHHPWWEKKVLAELKLNEEVFHLHFIYHILL